MDFAAFFTAFGIIAIAEFGDKTQIAAMTLASNYKPFHVFLGGLFGVALANFMGVLFGKLIGAFLPSTLVQAASGFVFIILGLYGLFS